MSAYNLSQIFGTSALPPEFYAGVEYEIEHLKSLPPLTKYGFISESDHSLRNNGSEFKTGPCTYNDSLAAFSYLHSKLSYGNEAFSERTSIHVHVNVGNFLPEQAKKFVLLYALLEPLFFEFVNKNRKNSIYCVPLNYTHLPDKYKQSFVDLCSPKIWHKYTAFNLLPVSTLGTIEFRHLEGTNNYDKFATWLKSIKQLHDVVFLENLDVLNHIHDIKEILSISRNVLPELTVKFNDLQMKELMADSILDVKLSVGSLS